MIKIGLIGCGQWGMNHLRCFNTIQECQIRKVAELNLNSAKHIHSINSTIQTTSNYKEILDDRNIDAVVISTPTITHFELVKESLEKGKHVLCEKPLCLHKSDAEKIIELAHKKNLTLMVGHVFLFNSGINYLSEILKKDDLGPLIYLKSLRCNLGPIRQDVNCIYDLAAHDVSIYNHLLNCLPTQVSTHGLSHLKNGHEDLAFILLKYPNNIIGHIHVSWLYPKKTRIISIITEEKMIIWDDLSQINPITIYAKKLIKQEFANSFGEFQYLSNQSEITIPNIKFAEPLLVQDQHFIDCILENRVPLTDGIKANQIINILEAADYSAKRNGAFVDINY